MRVISVNVNGIRAAKQKGFFEWLKTQKVDFYVCRNPGPRQYNSKTGPSGPTTIIVSTAKQKRKGYSRVAIYSHTRPDWVVDQFDWPLVDSEGRLIEIQIANLSILSLYALSGTSSSERQTLKFECLARFAALLSQFRNSGRDYIGCGDWKIAHRRIDLKNWWSNQNHSGFLPEERAWTGPLFREADWIGLSSHQPAT